MSEPAGTKTESQTEPSSLTGRRVVLSALVNGSVKDANACLPRRW